MDSFAFEVRRRAWTLNRGVGGGGTSVLNLQYGPRTRLVRGVSTMVAKPMKSFE